MKKVLNFRKKNLNRYQLNLDESASCSSRVNVRVKRNQQLREESNLLEEFWHYKLLYFN